MMPALTVIGLAIALFVSTNLDDIFVLLAFFADARFRPRQLVVGQLLGIAILAFGSFALSLASTALPTKYIGFLGVLPIVLGARMLVRAFRSRRQGEAADSSKTDDKSTEKIGTLAVTLVTLANGGDNVTAYVPFFATRSLWQSAIALVVFTLMTGVWCYAAHFLVTRPSLGKQLRKYGPVFLPWILIALGVYLFLDAGTLGIC